MSRAGASVLMLERQSEYRDQVRGEILWPWGVRLARQQVRSQLVVGADGRRSSVRRQVGAAFEIDKPAHLVAGMLVQGVAANAQDVNLQAREADLLFFSFPEEDGKARLYLCFPTHQR